MAMSSKWTQFADYSPVAESGASAHNFVFAPSPTMIYAPTACTIFADNGRPYELIILPSTASAASRIASGKLGWA